MAKSNLSKAITSQDVAARAGVSRSTVSLVMAGKAQGRVSVEVQAAVQRAAQELGYHPNAVARSLRLGRTFSVALVVPNVANPFFAAVLRGTEQSARLERYAVMLLDTMNDPDWLQWVPDVLAAHALDGVIVYGGGPIDDAQVARLGRRVVLVEAESALASCILLDVYSASRQACAYLLRLGHTRIGYLAADYPKATFTRRYEGYVDALAAAGIGYDPQLVVRTTFDLSSAAAAARRLLKNRPTAVCCDDDLLAAAVYKAAHLLRLDIPADLSVIGFNDIELARQLQPELTTVAIPADTIGKASIKLMQKLLKQREPVTRQLPLRLVVRGSTAPPR